MNSLLSKLRRWRRERSARRRRTATPPHPAAAAIRSGWRLILLRLTLLLLVWGVAAASFLLKPLHPVTKYVAGQVADRFLYAEQPFEYEDSEKTTRLRETASRKVPPVFEIRAAELERTMTRLLLIRDLLAAAANAGGDRPAPAVTPGMETEAPADPALEEFRNTLDARRRGALEYLALLPGRWPYLERLVASAAQKGVIAPEDLANHFGGAASGHASVYVRDELYRRRLVPFGELPTSGRVAAAVAAEFCAMYPDQGVGTQTALEEMLTGLIRPNLILDRTATEQAQHQAANLVPEAKTAVLAGAALLKRGERISAEDLVRIDKYQELLAGRPMDLALQLREPAVFAALFLLSLLAASYLLHAVHPEITRQGGALTAIAAGLILQILLTRVGGNLFLQQAGGVALLLPVVLPLTFGAMLLSHLVGLRVAALVGGLGSLAAAFQFDETLVLPIAGTLASFAAALLMRRARRRYQILWTGIGTAVMLTITAGMFLFHQSTPFEYYGPMILVGLATSVATAVLAAFASPVFEYLFGITTDLYLIEISDLNHPLLRRLQMEAPGTYHHSLMVATLSENAAAAIEANPLLARVCAYFHDIGKLSNPEYFTENAMGANPHEDLRPRLSSIVILNHVKSGLELALRYKLKRPIREAIAQHHGTSLVSYFYNRARQDRDAEDPEIGEHDYRYPGPLPARREVAIVSLADSCEAAVRSLVKPTPQKIRSQVAGIIRGKVVGGQLDDADLTLRELATVRESLVRTLTTMHHSRIQYPKSDEEKEAAAHATPRDPDQVEPAVDPARPETPA